MLHDPFTCHVQNNQIHTDTRNCWPYSIWGPRCYKDGDGWTTWLWNCSGMMRHSKIIPRWLCNSVHILSHWIEHSKWANCWLGEICLNKAVIKNKMIFFLFLLAELRVSPRTSSGKCCTTDFIPTLELIFLAILFFKKVPLYYYLLPLLIYFLHLFSYAS